MVIYVDTGDNTEVKRIIRIRKAADGVTDISCSDDIIKELLEKSDRWIDVQTGKSESEWLETDDEWEVVLETSENRAASKITGITKETFDELRLDYRDSIKALNRKDSDIQQTSFTPISAGVNITNELDPAVYTPEQTVFDNDEFGT